MSSDLTSDRHDVAIPASAVAAVDWRNIDTLPNDVDWFHGWGPECGVSLCCQRNGVICHIVVDPANDYQLALVEKPWPLILWQPIPKGRVQ